MKSSHTCNFFLASCGIPIPIHTSTSRSLIPCEAFYLDLGYIPYLHVSPWLGVKTIHVANSLTSQYSLMCILFVCVCVCDDSKQSERCLMMTCLSFSACLGQIWNVGMFLCWLQGAKRWCRRLWKQPSAGSPRSSRDSASLKVHARSNSETRLCDSLTHIYHVRISGVSAVLYLVFYGWITW